MSSPQIGIIGGSGLYHMDDFEIVETVRLSTPFGEPSDEYVIGKLGGKDVVFLPRHGRGHLITAPMVNYRANIYGMKMLGVTSIFSVSAVGSLKEQYHPGHIVLVDQFIDKTIGRRQTFFDEGVAVHILGAHPISEKISGLLLEACRKTGAVVHQGGTYVCMEGPALSTRAESLLHRSWGADVIGMTNMPEAKLAREAEIAYATMAMITDYDCWHEEEEAFSAEKIVETFKNNVKTAQKVLKCAAEMFDADKHYDAACAHALDGALISHVPMIKPETKKRLELLLGRFWKD